MYNQPVMAERRLPLTHLLEEFCTQSQKLLSSFIKFEDYQFIIHYIDTILYGILNAKRDTLTTAKDDFIFQLKHAPEKKRVVILTMMFGILLHEVMEGRSPLKHVLLGEEFHQVLQDLLEDPDIQLYSFNKDCTALMMKSLYVEQERMNRKGTEDLQHDFLLKLEHTMNKAYRLHWTSIRERMNIVKEELMAAAWHPRRVERLLDQGGWEAIEGM